jgi:hypothetical protein
MGVHHPDRGGTSWLMRASGVSFPTIRKALSGQAVTNEAAAQKLSAATGGEVTVEAIINPPRRRDAKDFVARTSRKSVTP